MRHYHNLSHEHKLTTDMGYLVPVATMEVLPGDTFIQRSTALVRLAPLVNPIMHNVDISMHHWYVPNRIIWNEWEDFITGEDGVNMPLHTIDTSGNDYDLLDHMGIPPADAMAVSELPIRAYNMIWNEFYRDQDLQTKRAEGETSLARVCWDKDYFTTARPYPQQGDAVTIGFDSARADVRASNTNNNKNWTGGTIAFDNNLDTKVKITVDSVQKQLYADLSTMTGGIDVNDLRRSIALQRFAEARMKFGSRYVDYLRFLGVNPKDGRLDRPEYIGGGKQRVNFSEVLATAEGTNTNVGDMFGHGIAGLAARKYRKMFEEHGWMITLMSVRPKSVYQDALPRKFTRIDPMDYWQKELQTLPWQEVKQTEIDYKGDEDTTFGYVPKYDEYRHEHNYVSNGFRTGGPEEDWHMGRSFGTPPTLNSSFVECTPTDRIYADKSMSELIINCHHKITAKRLVSQNAMIGSL